MSYEILCVVLSRYSRCNDIDGIDRDFSFTGDPKGCGTFFVYKFNENQKIALIISGDSESLELSTTSKNFSLPIDNLTVFICQFSNSNTDNYFCDDLIEQNEPKVLNTWDAVSGNVSILIDENSIKKHSWGNPYKISVEIDDVKLIDSTGDEIDISHENLDSVYVGWLAG